MSDRGTPTSRRRYEDEQVGLRAPHAVSEADSGGRHVPEPPHPYRTCFQRDRDRIVHCSAFRRLDFKTQVFVPHEDDHFRTRLTHTLEVAQVARDIGRALRVNEDLIEAAALAHDLGHPPFGHGGESVLDELMGDFGGFEHNRQSLRIVDYLEHPYPGFRGLNLTGVVRECLAKHETKYDRPVCEEFDLRRRAPLEGQIVDRSDEIAYTSADLEDALASGLIRVENLELLKLWNRARTKTETEYPDAREIHWRIRTTKAVLSEMADDLIAATVANLQDLNIDSADGVRDADRRVAEFSPSMRAAVDELQEFLLNNVYLTGQNARRTQEAERILRELFGAYLADASLLPERYQTRIDSQDPVSLHRAICDYIAGMTDRFCRRLHEQIRGR